MDETSPTPSEATAPDLRTYEIKATVLAMVCSIGYRYSEPDHPPLIDKQQRGWIDANLEVTWLSRELPSRRHRRIRAEALVRAATLFLEAKADFHDGRKYYGAFRELWEHRFGHLLQFEMEIPTPPTEDEFKAVLLELIAEAQTRASSYRRKR
jgi:hypothetical protein